MVKSIFYSTDKLWLKQVAGGSMKKKTMRVINQTYMDLIENDWRIHGMCKKKEIDKTMQERNPDTHWYFALWPVKKYVVAWYKN